MRLLQRKAQVGAAQFGEVPPGAPAGQWQRRIGAGGQRQVQLGGQMLDQKVEQGVDLAAMNRMIIIQHQDNIVRHIGQIVDEQGGYVIR